MTRLRLSSAALRDLEEAVEYIAADNPKAADRVRCRLLEAADRLRDFPKLGRRESGQDRVLVVPRTRFKLFYRIQPEEIRIMRIMHGARQWPPEQD